MSERESNRLESMQDGITIIFIVEMGIKLIGLGCVGYWSDSWNLLDGTIVSVSIVELLLNAMNSGTGMKVSFLRILRMLRVLRVMRLMRTWKGLYNIVTTFGRAIAQMTNLFILMFLFIVIFSLLGMQIFGGQFNPSTGFSNEPCTGGICPNKALEPLPRFYFDYFAPAVLTVFTLTTGEWVDAMDYGVHAVGSSAVLYYVLVLLFGRFLFMNLLVAIVLDAFTESDEVGFMTPGPAPAAVQASRESSRWQRADGRLPLAVRRGAEE